MTSAAEQPDPVDFRYDAELAGRIETKWQQRWQENRTFAAPNPVGDLTEVPRGVRPSGHLFGKLGTLDDRSRALASKASGLTWGHVMDSSLSGCCQG